MSYVPVSVGFWLLVGAGLTPPEAVEVLNDELERGTLRLWRDGIAVTASHFRRWMRIGRILHPPCHAWVAPSGAVGWQRYPCFAFEEAQVRKLIARLTTPPKPKRRPGARRIIKAASIKAELQRRQRENEDTSHKALARHFNVSRFTISRRLNPPKKKM